MTAEQRPSFDVNKARQLADGYVQYLFDVIKHEASGAEGTLYYTGNTLEFANTLQAACDEIEAIRQRLYEALERLADSKDGHVACWEELKITRLQLAAQREREKLLEAVVGRVLKNVAVNLNGQLDTALDALKAFDEQQAKKEGT